MYYHLNFSSVRSGWQQQYHHLSSLEKGEGKFAQNMLNFHIFAVRFLVRSSLLGTRAEAEACVLYDFCAWFRESILSGNNLPLSI